MRYLRVAVSYFRVTLKDFSAAPEYLRVTLKSCKGGPEDVSEGAMRLGAARRAFPEATFSLEAGSGGNDAVRSPVFEEVSSMLRRIALLVMLAGILPATVQALPRGAGPDAPAAVHSAQDWLLRLGSLFGDLWKRATENTGKSIDPNGQPQPQTQDGDTGMSIDPNG